ncbi:hypothetical protein RHMOL_Rhmol05G0150200 [Rhododendron molle]|uniref:Uncharacterized protein n=1 Tax=Rhododendron molle TaxID=49168 RepID=A0ACC0NRL3_RHOML|nr:hypothetical protein RHMOL_Rhmol05G0150200 [Rhododendron molle]
MEELGKVQENVQIFEENMSEAYNGFDEASRQFKLQVGSSSTVATVANLPAPPESATQTHLPFPANMQELANPFELANPPVPVIDVGQEMIAPAA